nr:formin-like protein 18 [Ipomoea batatas]
MNCLSLCIYTSTNHSEYCHYVRYGFTKPEVDIGDAAASIKPLYLATIRTKLALFDCCFTSDVLKDEEYDNYMGGIVHKLCQHLPDSSFMVFNFREGENQSQIEAILKGYDMTVINYPHHYENCPILTMETIHHFLRSSESWLSLGPSNVLLLHCELGGWPVLAFMLAALLIFRKQYSGEQKTLDIIYKQAPRELLQLMLPLNPLPSQLRYLRYVSRRNLGSEWPPLDRALTLDYIILRDIPNADGEGGCRPIFRIYGQDPFMAADRTPKVLFSTPKKSNAVRHYKQGDVVIECITLDDELEGEEMVFRVMFNTAFIRSNILILNRDELDILWDVKDEFSKDFRAEVLFSEMNSASSMITPTFLDIDDQGGGLPSEAFAKVREIFSNVDWLDPRTDVALDILEIRAANIIQERLENISPRPARKDKLIKSASTLTNEVIENFICQSPTDEDFETSFLELARKLKIGSSTFQDAIEGINLPTSTSKKNNSGKSGALLAELYEGVTDELDSSNIGDSFPSPKNTPMLVSKLMTNDDETPKSSQLENDTKPQDRQIPLHEPRQSEVPSHPPPPVLPPSRFHGSGGSTVGITALLKESTSSVTMSPRHAILASVPGLLKPLSPRKSLLSPQLPSSSQFPLGTVPSSQAAVSLITSKLASLIPPSVPTPPPPDGQDSNKVPESSTTDPPCAPPSSSGIDPVPAASSIPPPPQPFSSANAMPSAPPPPPPPGGSTNTPPPPPPPGGSTNTPPPPLFSGGPDQDKEIKKSGSWPKGRPSETGSDTNWLKITPLGLSKDLKPWAEVLRGRAPEFDMSEHLRVLSEKLPEVLDFPNDLESLEAASKLQLKFLAEEMQAVSKGLEKIQQELTASENDGPTLKDFLGYCESEVKSLATLYSGVGRNADALALYFGEDPARCPFEQVVSTLLNFVRMFKKAHEENCKQLEFERKKAEKEAAENDKAKLNNDVASKNELGDGKTKMSSSCMGTEQLIQTA